ncbi:hypothetical protein BX661DRAFT_177800 [Kickxella alabastrina]|uniref:uncharacterized protein n=1 Tax=Kickxella alabastrina TaxID=61397 RepID=UPI0022208FD0|nr:uncharacterized protein BX661DRAFT_177800 [Kickxella alabastrina]KAI7833912.1 hypothetical protein BX661DRAFT_177800 [Kickxella alabastrina]
MLRATLSRRTARVLQATQRKQPTQRRAYSTAGETPAPAAAEKTKERPRIRYMGISEPSAALRRMTQQISTGELDVNTQSDIDAFRFTTDDLLRDLPMQRARVLGDATTAAMSLAVASREETTELLAVGRRQRAEQIKRAFTAKQLGAYLGAHGERRGGTKSELAMRIIDKLWGISAREFAARLEKPREPTAVADGLTLPLGEGAQEQVRQLAPGAVAELEREYAVTIAIAPDCATVRAAGPMHAVRGALSALRERLTADTTVEVDVARYTARRPLSARHVSRVAGKLAHAMAHVTVSSCDGELFVGGERRAALDAQQALVSALGESRDAFFGVVPRALSGPVATLVPAAAVFSRPRSFVPDAALHVQGVSELAAPVAALSHHTLFAKPGGAALQLSAGALPEALRAWCGGAGRVRARLGRVLIDADCGHAGEPLGARFHDASELLRQLGERAPLFGFAPDVSALRWLHGSKDAPLSRYVELTFRRIALAAGGAKCAYTLPVYADDSLVVRIPADSAQLRFGDMRVRCHSDERAANVALLGAPHDFQVLAHTEAAADGVQAEEVRRVAARLGLLGDGAQVDARRHDVVQLGGGGERFALTGASVEAVVRRRIVGGLAASMHQTWDIIDDLRFSQVHLHAQADDIEKLDWDRFLVLVFQAAHERPTTLATSTPFH